VDPCRQLLEELRLLDFESYFHHQGATSLERLADMRFEDLLEMGLTKVQAHLFLASVAGKLGRFEPAVEEMYPTMLPSEAFLPESQLSCQTEACLPATSPWLTPAGHGRRVVGWAGGDRWQPVMRQPSKISLSSANGADTSWFANVFVSFGAALGGVLAGRSRSSSPQGLPGLVPDSTPGSFVEERSSGGPEGAAAAIAAAAVAVRDRSSPSSAVQTVSGGSWWRFSLTGMISCVGEARNAKTVDIDGSIDFPFDPSGALEAELPSPDLATAANVAEGVFAVPGSFTMVSTDYWCVRTMQIAYVDEEGCRKQVQQSGYSLRISLPASAVDLEIALSAIGGPEVQAVDRSSPGSPFIVPRQVERFRYARCPESVQFEISGNVLNPYISSVTETGSRHLVPLSLGHRFVDVPEVIWKVGALAGFVAARSLRTASRSVAAALKEVLADLSRFKYIYVCGGSCKADGDSVDRFCPRTRTWSRPPSTCQARCACAMASTGGQLFVMCGASAPKPWSGRVERMNSVSLNDERRTAQQPEVYDPISGTWELLPAMGNDYTHAAATAAGGFIYVFGGLSSGQVLNRVYRLDPLKRCWERMEDLPSARFESAACSLGGFIYVLGGATLEGEVLALVERYNPKTNQWMTMPRMQEPRYGCAAVAAGGLVFAIGGRGLWSDLAQVEYFDPRKGWGRTLRWQEGPTLRQPRHRCGAVAIGRIIYVLGGSGDGEDIVSMEVLNLDTFEWENCGETPSKGGHCAAVAVTY